MMNRHKKQSSVRSGFTLMELLAVMGIVALLSTLAMTSYFSAIRGMARRSAGDHFQNALAQARQRACIDGARTSLIAFNQPLEYDSSGTLSKFLPSYVVCRELGRVSYVNQNYVFDEYADLRQLFGSAGTSSSSQNNINTDYKSGVRLYNLSQGWWTMVKPRVSLQQFGSSSMYLFASYAQPDTQYKRHTFEAYAFELISDSWAKSKADAVWRVGDSYGVEVSPIYNLPKTFYFDELPDDAASANALTEIHYVTFEPDGTLGSSSSPARFTIKSADKNMTPITYGVDSKGSITN